MRPAPASLPSPTTPGLGNRTWQTVGALPIPPQRVRLNVKLLMVGLAGEQARRGPSCLSSGRLCAFLCCQPWVFPTRVSSRSPRAQGHIPVREGGRGLLGGRSRMQPG